MSTVRSLHWDITKKCNLRCKHCYNAEKYFNIDSDDYISEEMDLEQCLNTVRSFSEAGFKHIHFLGGEPLMSPYIYDTTEYAKKLGMTITINSNACLLDSAAQKKLIDLKVDQFAASLDGCSASVNDAIRGSGTFERIVSNMKAFNELKSATGYTETALVFTLTKANMKDLMLLPALAEDIGVDLIVLTTFIESGQGKEHRDVFDINIEDVCDAVENMVSSELVRHPVPLQIDMRPRFCQYLSAKYKVPVLYNVKNTLCSAGENVLYLEADGNIHPCLIFQLESGKKALKNNIFKKQQLNVISDSITDIQSSQYWNTFLDAKNNFETAKIPTCKECEYLGECQPCFLDYSGYNIPVSECEWTKRKERALFDDIKDNKIYIADSVTFDESDKTIYVDDEAVITFNNDISFEIWELLSSHENAASIFENLKNEYDIAEEKLQYDIAVYLYMLNNNGIIHMFEQRPEQCYALKADLVCEHIGDEVVVFDTGKQQFYEFHGIANSIWNNIEKMNLNDTIESVCKEYDIDMKTASDDVCIFLCDLLKKELIFKVEVI